MPLNPNDIQALQISLLIPTSIALVLKLAIFGHYFSAQDCGNLYFMGLCLGYVLQFIVIKLNHLITTHGNNPVCLIISTVCSCCGCTSFIVVTSIFISFSTFNETDPDNLKFYNICDNQPKLALGLEMIGFALFPIGVGLIIADVCRTHKKKPEELTGKQFSFTFIRIVFQTVHQLALMLVVIAFLHSTLWGLAVFLSFEIPLLVWIMFVTYASRAKLTEIKVKLDICIKRDDRVEFCTFLLSVLFFLISPIFQFILGSLGMMELWHIEDNNPRQYFFVNINLLLKLLFLLPVAVSFLAFTLVEDIEFYFVVGFFAFWIFALGNITFPYIETCRRFGCKYRHVLSTPINSIFTKEEVEHYYTHDVQRIKGNKQNEKEKA